MKRIKGLFQLLAICMMACSFYACEEEGLGNVPDGQEKEELMIWDFAPINLHFTLTGEDGEDLLAPATPGSYSGLALSAVYKEKTYEKDVFEENRIPYSRAYLPHMYGLYTTQQKDGRYALTFGELDGAGKYEDATIVLRWGDHTEDIITFSGNLTWKDNKPILARTFKLNGEIVAENTNNPVIDIPKKAIQSQGNQLAFDVEPIVFNFQLTDSLGGNLLNLSKEKYTGKDSIKAIFQGEAYYINIQPENSEDNESDTPNFTGLTLARYPQTMYPHPLKFGELDGTETYEDENLIMDWGSLGKDTITFTSKITWENNRPIFVRSYSLNGKEVEKDLARPYIRIVK